MPILKLDRTTEYMNRLRNYKVYIDNAQIGTIADGQSKEFEVIPGTHTVRTTVDWCSSPIKTFTVDEVETKTFKTGAFKNAKLFLSIMIITIVFDVVLTQFFKSDYLMYALAAELLFFIYILSVGRKKYLSLEETTLS